MIDFLVVVTCAIIYILIEKKYKTGFGLLNPLLFFLAFTFSSLLLPQVLLDISYLNETKLVVYSFLLVFLFSILIFGYLKRPRIITGLLPRMSERDFQVNLKLYYYLIFLFVATGVLVKLATGTIVMGLDAEKNVGGLAGLLLYFLVVIGVNHTSPLGLVGLLALGYCIYQKNGNRKYLVLAFLINVILALITAQKSYLLYAVVIFGFLGNAKFGKLAQLIYVSGIGVVLYTLNLLRQFYFTGDSSSFGYFSLIDFLTYAANRVDLAKSAELMLENNLVSPRYFVELLLSIIPMIPRSLIYPDGFSAIRIASMLGYDAGVGITIAPFVELYLVAGMFGIFAFSVIAGFFYSEWHKMAVSEDMQVRMYYLLLLPVGYSLFYTQSLPELILYLNRFILGMWFFYGIFNLITRLNFIKSR